jgi:uncharacterized repeat protein (TIGR01451 family)
MLHSVRKLLRHSSNAIMLIAIVAWQVLFPLVAAQPAYASHLGQYNAALTAPTPPGSSTTYVWQISGSKPHQGQEISHVDFTGCWSANQLLGVVASSGDVETKNDGSFKVDNLQDDDLPLTVTATFSTLFPSTGTVDIFVKTGGSSDAGFPFEVSGPNCDVPNPEPASLTVAKEVTEGSDTEQAFPFTVTDQTGFSLSHGEDETFDELEAGTYTIAEDLANLPDWDLEDVDCDSHPFVQTGYSIDIVLADGDEVTCTFVNDENGDQAETGSITVVKDATPDSTREFTFTGNLDTPFSLVDDGENPELASKSFSELDDGVYNVTEPAVSGWELESIVCEGDDASDINVNERTANIDLKNGEDITCTFTNAQDQIEPRPTTLTVNKQIDSDGDGIFEGGNTEANALGFGWLLDEDPTERDMGSSATVSPGDHMIDETVVPGYHFVGWFSGQGSCAEPDVSSLPLLVNAAADETTVVTLCNAADEIIEPAPVQLLITKSNNRPDPTTVGDTVTYTIEVSLPQTSGPSFNTCVTDLPPENFQYISGSWTASSDNPEHAVSADVAAASESCGAPDGPSYSSPGSWFIGTLIPGEVVTLTYRALILGNVTPGDYPDIAFASGYSSLLGEGDPDVLSNVSAGASSPFVGTLVSVIEEGSAGQVLGVSTLPRTASPLQLMEMFMLPGAVGTAYFIYERRRLSREARP